MADFKHKKVVTEHYEINLGGYYRTIGGRINPRHHKRVFLVMDHLHPV